MRAGFILALLALCAMPAAAATVQQDFDAAQAKLDTQDYVGARTAFNALLTRFPPGSKGKAASLVRIKLGSTLIATNEPEAAVEMLTSGIDGLKPATPAENEVAANARFDLGRAEEATGALDRAAGAYRAALALNAFPAGSPMDVAIRAGLARTLIWSNPAEARQLLDGLLALPPAQLSGDPRGLVLTLRGRVELNNGDPEAAKRWFEQAATAAGGSQTRKINIADIRIRGDLALANYALGDMTSVTKALHYAGADGDLPMIFGKAVTPLPNCAPLTGLTPDTVAVVEFGIGDDGRVMGATPVYARRGAGMAPPGEDQGPEALFVEAVRNWYWPAEQARAMPLFWRQAIRVELRCLTQRGGGDSVIGSFHPAYAAWYDKLGVVTPPDFEGNDAAQLPRAEAELARRIEAHGPNSPQLLPLLSQIATNRAASAPAQAAAAERYLQLLQQTEPPAELLLVTRLWVATATSTTEPQVIGKLNVLLSEAEAAGQGSTRAAMAVRLILANYLGFTGARFKARPLYAAVAAAPANVLPEGDPIRQQALLRTADDAARRGDTGAANQAIAATGLAPEQCALIDVRPQKINGKVTEESFPAMAKTWGSSGYVKTGFDISVDGRPQGVRTVIASPPFIFGPETEKAVARFRYSPVFRPGNTVGCSAQTQSVRFRGSPTY